MRRILIFFCLLLLSITTFAQSKNQIISKIRLVSYLNGIDSDLALAVAMTESSLNPKAVGPKGEVGLFQLRPRYHSSAVSNFDMNISLGVSYLKKLKLSHSSIYPNSWFVLFNYGPNFKFKRSPNKTKYYSKVMKQLGDIKFKRYVAKTNSETFITAL